MNKKNRTRLKFALFVIFVVAMIIALLILENYRNHPEYAPMFSSIVALPALYLVRRRCALSRRAVAAGSSQQIAINQD